MLLLAAVTIFVLFVTTKLFSDHPNLWGAAFIGCVIIAIILLISEGKFERSTRPPKTKERR